MQLRLNFDKELSVQTIEPILYKHGIIRQNIDILINSYKFRDSQLKLGYLDVGSNILLVQILKTGNSILIQDIIISYEFLDSVLEKGYTNQLMQLNRMYQQEHEKVIQLQKEVTESRIKNIQLQELGQVKFQFN